MSRFFLVSYKIITDTEQGFGDISFSTGGLFFSRKEFVNAVKKEYPNHKISKVIITSVFEFKNVGEYNDYIYQG